MIQSARLSTGLLDASRLRGEDRTEYDRPVGVLGHPVRRQPADSGILRQHASHRYILYMCLLSQTARRVQGL